MVAKLSNICYNILELSREVPKWVMLTGEFHHQIDEKGRLRIPSKLKEELGKEPVLVKGSSGCLFILPKERAEKLFASCFDDCEFADFVDDERTRALRDLASSYTPIEEDKQGRVQIPASLIKLAGITKNVVTIGAFSRAEIWSEENWETYRNGNGGFKESVKSLTQKHKAAPEKEA